MNILNNIKKWLCQTKKKANEYMRANLQQDEYDFIGINLCQLDGQSLEIEHYINIGKQFSQANYNFDKNK